MTCIVGLEHGGEVWLGADSICLGDLDATSEAHPKVFRNGPMIFGATGSFRVSQLLEHALAIPKHGAGADRAYLCTSFVDAVRSLFIDKGATEIKDGQVHLDGRFLFGYRGRLYAFESNFQIIRSASGYEAAGCGAPIARGSMFSTSGHPRVRLRTALAAAAAWNAGVRGPYHVIHGAHQSGGR